MRATDLAARLESIESAETRLDGGASVTKPGAVGLPLYVVDNRLTEMPKNEV